jgi:hypothetical protein
MLRAAPRLSVVPTCRPVDLVLASDGTCSVALGRSHRLLLRFRDEDVHSACDPNQITHVQVVGVIDDEQ